MNNVYPVIRSTPYPEGELFKHIVTDASGNYASTQTIEQLRATMNVQLSYITSDQLYMLRNAAEATNY
ncbi:hypothetical protein ACDQ55_10315 [Chitinophaga sp. 30R24]|uniref:hypothetical protein n=1 Tax=Chitinophaga sp. 30R24 TaxID=3248838 RepID=UPI003B91588D